LGDNIYINCKMERVSDTEYRLFAQMLKLLILLILTFLPKSTKWYFNFCIISFFMLILL